MLKRLSAVLLLLGLALRSHAVVTHLPPEAAPGTQPAQQSEAALVKALAEISPQAAAFPFWSNIGTVGLGTGVYLGEGTVLTSRHVGCFPFLGRDGARYAPRYESWGTLTNADGSESDLAVFQIEVPAKSRLAALPRVPVAPQTAGQFVVMVGNGYIQGAQPLRIGSPAGASEIFGYRIEARRGSTWAINRQVETLERAVTTGRSLHTECLVSRFENAPFAGQATSGDSGGAAFAYDSAKGEWALVGCIIAVTQQRPIASFGAQTFLGNLAAYDAQIALRRRSRVAKNTPRRVHRGSDIPAQPVSIAAGTAGLSAP